MEESPEEVERRDTLLKMYNSLKESLKVMGDINMKVCSCVIELSIALIRSSVLFQSCTYRFIFVTPFGLRGCSFFEFSLKRQYLKVFIPLNKLYTLIIIVLIIAFA